MQVFWFSNRCPFFSANHASEYAQKTNSYLLCDEKLLHLGYVKAAHWLKKHKEKWVKFVEGLNYEIDIITKCRAKVIYYNSPDYPEKLKHLCHPPALLIAKGNTTAFNMQGVAIVGAREPTYLGREWVQTHVLGLVKNNFSVISGGARGIDYEAHKACIKAQGQTISFLPSGINQPYPQSHAYLFEEIVDKNGLLLTEFISTDDVRKNNFHQRNRLIAGLAEAVVIVEAAPKSGTYMTANKALSENKDVLVVPGSPLLNNYAGSLEILYQGAALARNSKDIVEKIRGVSYSYII